MILFLDAHQIAGLHKYAYCLESSMFKVKAINAG